MAMQQAPDAVTVRSGQRNCRSKLHWLSANELCEEVSKPRGIRYESESFFFARLAVERDRKSTDYLYPAVRTVSWTYTVDD